MTKVRRPDFSPFRRRPARGTSLWYQVPGWTNSANIDMIAIYMTGLRDIPRLIPVHRLIWRSWYRSEPGRAAGGEAPRLADKTPAGQSH